MTLSFNSAYMCRLLQISTRGLTGSIRFDEKGRRKDVKLDVLNLRNNSFVKVIFEHFSQKKNVKA